MLLKTKPNVLFVVAQGIESNSGYHVQWYANSLIQQGANCVVAVPDQVVQDRSDNLWVVAHSDIEFKSPVELFRNGRGADVVVAWTPREIVRKCVQSLFDKKPSRLVVHMEDNEEYLTEVSTGLSKQDLSALSLVQLDNIVPRDRYHPVRGRRFLRQANAVTYLIDILGRYASSDGLQAEISAPINESLFYERPINYGLRNEFGISDTECVIVYSGNVHDANADEVLVLYKAVRHLQQSGHAARLIRTGKNTGSVATELADQFESLPGLIDLGWVDRLRLAEISACANLFVQPGGSNPFNDERVPSKLPEYFALGRPVVMSRCNIGHKAQHLSDAYLTDCSDIDAIIKAVTVILEDRSLMERLSVGARRFYENSLRADEMALPGLIRLVLRSKPVELLSH